MITVVSCSLIIVGLSAIVINAEQNLNKDIIDSRLNITIIMKDIQNNCSRLLLKYPYLLNLPNILPTCWRVHQHYKYAKIVITILILHDSITVYLVAGGPLSFFLMSCIIGICSIIGVFVSQMSFLLLLDFIYIVFGFVIISRLFNKCFRPFPPEELRML